MKMTIGLIVLALCVGGCGYQDKARTSLGASVWGWNFDDSKDNDITLKGAKWGDKSVDELVIRNNASDVNKSIAEIAIANARVAEAHGKNIEQALNAIANIASRIPGANPMPAPAPADDVPAPSGEVTDPASGTGDNQ